MGEGQGREKIIVTNREGGRQTIRGSKYRELRVDGVWGDGKVGDGHWGGHLLG